MTGNWTARLTLAAMWATPGKRGGTATLQTPSFPSVPLRTAIYKNFTFCTHQVVLSLFPSDSFRLHGHGKKRHKQWVRTKHAEEMQWQKNHPSPQPPESQDIWTEATFYTFILDAASTKREFPSDGVPHFQFLLCMRETCTYQHPLILMEEDIRWEWTWS